VPTAFEERVAHVRGIRHQDRNLSQAIADFYLLENLANVRHYSPAVRLLDELERDLSRQFAEYLDIAIGGELRHATGHLELDEECLPIELAPFFREVTVSSSDRGKAWLVWGIIRRRYGMQALELAEDVFRMDGWQRNFGGVAWARVVVALREYLQGKIKRRIFVDRCFSLEHNSGCVFDKLWSTGGVHTVLSSHGVDDYATLLAHASTPVRRLWRQRNWIARRDYDPIWLGVQPTDSVEDLWPEAAHG
jgi:hypothetical protein